jgi:diacylglycerol kinase (ATP)
MLLVLAVGGDGTVREAAEGMARGLGRWPGVRGGTAQAALFVVPAGSGNSAYHELWGTQDWCDCLDTVLKARGCHVRDIDLVRISEVDRGSLLGVNVGLIARIADVIERSKTRSDSPQSRSQQASEQDDDQARYWAALSGG